MPNKESTEDTEDAHHHEDDVKAVFFDDQGSKEGSKGGDIVVHGFPGGPAGGLLVDVQVIGVKGIEGGIVDGFTDSDDDLDQEELLDGFDPKVAQKSDGHNKGSDDDDDAVPFDVVTDASGKEAYGPCRKGKNGCRKSGIEELSSDSSDVDSIDRRQQCRCQKDQTIAEKEQSKAGIEREFHGNSYGDYSVFLTVSSIQKRAKIWYN